MLGSGEGLMPRLHYVPGGHGNHVSGHRGQNGMDVRPRGRTGWANVTVRVAVDAGPDFLTVKKFATVVTVRMRNLVGRRKTRGTQ